MEIEQNSFLEKLERLKELILKNADEAKQLFHKETNKTLFDCNIEIERAIETINACKEISIEKSYSTEDNIPGEKLDVIYIPLGTIGVITPFNHPFNIPLHSILPALRGGNKVKWKGATECPKSSKLLFNMLSSCGFNIDYVGSSINAGKELVKSNIDGIVFVGGVETGLNITKNSGIKKLVLELGGNDSVLIFPDFYNKQKEKTIDIVLRGRFSNSGQRCSSTKRIIVHEDIIEDFLKSFKEATKKLSSNESKIAKVGGLISNSAAIDIEKMIISAVEDGAELVYGGKRINNFLEPTILSSIKKDMTIFKNECFGPVASLIKFNNTQEAITLANATEYGLQSSILTYDESIIQKCVNEIKCGGIVINGPTGLRSEWMPFGGVKSSGFGRMGPNMLTKELMTTKTILRCKD